MPLDTNRNRRNVLFLMDRSDFIIFFLVCFISGSLQTPHLNVSSTIDISMNSPLQLLCWGQYPLGWHYPQQKNNVSLPVIEEVREQSRYMSKLKIDRTNLDDRGEYICHYVDSSYEESGNFASVKVFVNDPVDLILQPDSLYLSWCPDQPLTVPCMPTNSMVNITLWINGQETNHMVHANDVINFNPFEGFTIPINFSVTSIDCIGQLNDQVTKPLTFSIHSSTPANIPQMIITSDPDHYALINGTVILTCLVNTEELVYRPQWHNIRNTMEQRLFSEVIVGDNNISDVLTINDVKKTDEGCYSCEINTPCNKLTEEICITVYDTKPLPSFNLSTHIDKPLLMKSGEKLVLVAYIDVFPLDSANDIDFFWWKDGKLIAENDVRFNASLMLPKKAVLRVSSLNFSDAGIYTFSGNTTEESENISVTVLVEGEPQITISGRMTEDYYMAGSRNVFLCDVKGKPLPNVTWFWKPCSSYNVCDTNTTALYPALAAMDLPNTERVMLGDISEFQRICRLEVRARQTGFYSCVAGNEYGSNEEKLFFLVTDAKNGLQTNLSVTKPVEMDNVTIECRANSYQYKDVRWQWIPLGRRNFSIEFSENSEYTEMDVISSATPYSHQMVISFHPIHFNNSGTYICYAEPLNNLSFITNSSITFVVRDLLKPVIVSTNLNGSTVKIPPNQEYEFYCFAKGIPEPIVTWYRNNQVLNATDSTALYFKASNQMMIINRVIKTDEGIYHCNATNRGGFVVRNVTLQVITGQEEETSGFRISLTHVVIIVCVLVGAVLICLLYIFGSKIYKNKLYRRRFPFMIHSKFSQGHLELLNSDLPFEEQAELLPYDHCWEFPKDRLKLGVTLGQGVFGRVVKAEAIGLIATQPSTTVAVKLLKEQADINQQKALMTELKILAHLGHHVNIVNLLGAVTKNLHKGELMVLVEYCHYGNLRHYLLNNRDNFINQIDKTTGEIDIDISDLPFLLSTSEDDDQGSACNSAVVVGTSAQPCRSRAASTSELLHYRRDSMSAGVPSRRSSVVTIPGDDKKEIAELSTCDLLSYSFQCARGMEYLASKKLLHRDLAARNVLLAERNVIKICDFGLAKDLYEYGSYVKKGDGPLPIKWMAIESIRDKVFTTKSDVWSYGILLWEIFTLGRNPYPGIDLNEQFFKKLNDGYRMEKPEYSPNCMYKIMNDCWEAEPKNRPDFRQIVDKLGTILEDSMQQHYVDLNEQSETAANNGEDDCNFEIHDYMNVDRQSPSISSNEGSQRKMTPNHCGSIQSVEKPSPTVSLNEDSQRIKLSHYESIQSMDKPRSTSSNDSPQKTPLRHYDSLPTLKPEISNLPPRVPMEAVPRIQLENDPDSSLLTDSQTDINSNEQHTQLVGKHLINNQESSDCVLQCGEPLDITTDTSANELSISS